MSCRNGHFTFVNIDHLSQRHYNLLVLSFVVHCSITVDKVLEFCKIMCNIVLTLVSFYILSQLCYFFSRNNWRCHFISWECLSPGVTDNKGLQCSSQMWLRQQSTLHWGGTLWQDQSAGVGGPNKSQPALYRLYPTVISGGTRVYYSQPWRSDSSDYKIELIPIMFKQFSELQ